MNCIIFVPTLTAGGAERVASILANEWSLYPDVKVIVITLFSEEIFFPLNSRVKHLCLGIKANQTGLKRFIDLARSLLKLRACILTQNPSFVLSLMNKYNIFCLISLFGSGQTVIVGERDSPTEILSWQTSLLRKLTYPYADAVLVQSVAARNILKETVNQKRIFALPNPVAQLVNPESRKPEKYILNVARLHPKKGQADLLEAFAQVNVPGWKVLFCGDGPSRPELERHASRLGLSDRVCFLGTRSDIRPYLIEAGIFAFTSYWEGFPNALAEAMLVGIPCISYDCPTGPSELIDNGVNGILVPVGDVDRLTTALEHLMTNTELADALGARASNVAAIVELHAVSERYWDLCVQTAEAATAP